MLYNAYEMQRSLLAGASAFANISAKLLQSPAHPANYFGGGPVLASALEVFAHASAPRGKPAFGLTSTMRPPRTATDMLLRPSGRVAFLISKSSMTNPSACVH